MSGLFRTVEPTGVWWKDHSLSLVITAILLAQTAFLVWGGHAEWVTQQKDHGANAFGWGGEFWTWWTYEYVVSLVADTYGVLLIVVLSKWLVERGSAESN